MVTTQVRPAWFHLLAKPTGAVCNLDCTYCFILSKEALLPWQSIPDDGRDARGLHRAIDRGAHNPRGHRGVQGGEPTMMGLDFFGRAVELA